MQDRDNHKLENLFGTVGRSSVCTEVALQVSLLWDTRVSWMCASERGQVSDGNVDLSNV